MSTTGKNEPGIQLSDDELKALAEQVAPRLKPGRYSDRMVLTRRQLFGVAAGTISLGALLGGGASEASAQDDTVWNVGDPDNPVNVYGEQGEFDSLTMAEATITGGRGFLGLPTHHVNYEDGLSNEEIARFTLEEGHTLQVWRLEAKLKGGGTDEDFTVDVYDETDDAVIASTTDRATGESSPVGSSVDGATILIRISNATGSGQDVCITGISDIVNT